MRRASSAGSGRANAGIDEAGFHGMRTRGMTRNEALLTIGLVCIFFAAITSFQFVYRSISIGNKLSSSLHRNASTQAPEVRNAALALRHCAEKNTGKDQCFMELSNLKAVLQRTAIVDFDFYRSGFFETFIQDDTLILRRNSCAEEDVAHQVIAWSAWSYSNARSLTGEEIKSGEYGGYQNPDQSGRRFGDTCLLVIVLPILDLKRLVVSLISADQKTVIWTIDQDW
jgi:hypothetical protein